MKETKGTGLNTQANISKIPNSTWKEIFQNMKLCNTNKLQLTNVFFLLYCKLGWNVE